MAQQTAVEWVVLQMLEKDSHRIWPSLLERAKQMEKEQIINAYRQGFKNAQDYEEVGREQYYNETYNKKA